MTVGIGCDIGGTFTDLVVIDEATGRIDVEKVLTTPSDPSLGIEAAGEKPGGVRRAGQAEARGR